MAHTRKPRSARAPKPTPPPVNPRQALLYAVRGWRHWNGRATRSEFWSWTFIAAPTWLILTSVAANTPAITAQYAPALLAHPVPLVLTATVPFAPSIAIWVISLSAYARRVHDTGRRSWWAITATALPTATIAALTITMALTGTTPGSSQLSPAAITAGTSILATSTAWQILLGVIACLPSTPHPTPWDTGYRPSRTKPRKR